MPAHIGGWSPPIFGIYVLTLLQLGGADYAYHICLTKASFESSRQSTSYVVTYCVMLDKKVILIIAGVREGKTVIKRPYALSICT